MPRGSQSICSVLLSLYLLVMEHNYTPEELEKQYSPSQWATSHDLETVVDHYFEQVSSESKKVAAHISDVIKLNYGESVEQNVDIFGGNLLPKDAPIFVFVHGGYWVTGSLETSSFFVQPFYDAGIVSAALGYDVISDNITLPDIVQQAVKGIHTIVQYAKERGSKGVYLCGHSAGGHLIAAALSTKANIDYKMIKGVFPVSGLFDLCAFLSTENAKAARITKEICETYSPLRAVKQLKDNLSVGIPVSVLVGEHESDAFHQQSEVYAKALKSCGTNADFKIVSGEDHFSVILKLRDPSFSLTREFIKLMKRS